MSTTLRSEYCGQVIHDASRPRLEVEAELGSRTRGNLGSIYALGKQTSACHATRSPGSIYDSPSEKIDAHLILRDTISEPIRHAESKITAKRRFTSAYMLLGVQWEREDTQDDLLVLWPKLNEV